MPKFWREWQRPVELTLLLLLILFLPLREAPKNLFWVAFLVVWVVNRVRERDFGPPWSGWASWDGLCLAWIASSYLSAMFAGIHRGNGNEVLAVNDQVKYVSVLWCLMRGGYTRKESITLLVALVASCVIAEIEALWFWRVVHKLRALELKSVGAVNHSAIYMTICLGIDAVLALAYWRELSNSRRALLVGAGVLLLAGLFLTGSRAAAVIAVLLLCVLATIASQVLRLGRAPWAGALLVIAVALALGGTSALQRQIQNSAVDNVLSQRDLIWNRGLTGWRATPWFGVGPDNYSQITERDLRTELALEGKRYDPRDFEPAPHAHNLYVNTLVERGVVGLAALLAVLGVWGVQLWRHRPRAALPVADRSATPAIADPRQGAAPADLVLWGASFSGWVVTVGIGMANTTLHHEHALLALITLGLWLPTLRPRLDVPDAAGAARAAPLGT